MIHLDTDEPYAMEVIALANRIAGLAGPGIEELHEAALTFLVSSNQAEQVMEIIEHGGDPEDRTKAETVALAVIAGFNPGAWRHE